MTEEKARKRFLVLVDADRARYVHQVFDNYDWARVIDLQEDEFPAPPGSRLVSAKAWEVLRQGARIPIGLLNYSLEVLGTRCLSADQQTHSEKWCLAELDRRGSEDVDYDE